MGCGTVGFVAHPSRFSRLRRQDCGLGLTIVSHFANEAGGSFHLDSELGFGARNVSLPVV